MDNKLWVSTLLGLLLASSARAQAPNPGLPGGGSPMAPDPVAGLPLGAALSPLTELDLQAINQEYLQLRRSHVALEARLRELRQKLTDDSPDVKAALVELEALDKAMALLKARITAEQERARRGLQRSSMLLTRVAVDLQNATVRQAADALQQATRVPIQVDNQVPANLRLSVTARGITLGAVLEAVARQANLKLAPIEGGAVITTWPMVDVNGQFQVFKGPWAPWAVEWGQLPGALTGSGWSFPGDTGGFPGAPQGVAMGAPTMPMHSGEQDLHFARVAAAEREAAKNTAVATASSLAALGDRHVAVAEPGSGPAGQAGVWITIYRVEGSQLKKAASTFHALRNSSAGSGMMPGSTGLGGLPGGLGGNGLGGAYPGTSSLGGTPGSLGVPGLEVVPPRAGAGNPFGGSAGKPSQGTGSNNPFGGSKAKPGTPAPTKPGPKTPRK
jgi:hypothetical protein